MFKKILGWIILIALFVGSVCGVTFGILYSNLKKEPFKNESNFAQVELLELEISQLKNEKNTLLGELSLCQKLNSDLTKEVSGLTVEIESLTILLEEIQKELEYKIALLEAYGDLSKYSVAFYSDGIIQKLILVDPNTNVNIALVETPEKEGYTFKGWALQGTTEIIDISSYIVTEDTAFTAIYEKLTSEVLFSGKEQITYYSPGSSVFTESITIPLSSYFPDIDFTGNIQVAIDMGLHAPYGEAVSSPRDTILRSNEDIVSLSGPEYGEWGTMRLMSNGKLFIELNGASSVSYCYFTIYEIVRIF